MTRGLPDQAIYRYVIVTAAFNEGKHIGRLLEAVVSQTSRPLRWIVVTDGCTDNTADIVRAYSATWRFIELVELAQHRTHDFASKVRAFDAGVELLDGTSFEFLGNLDADVTMRPSYFAELLGKFREDEALGIAGGAIWELDGGGYRPRCFNTTTDVAGAVQMFRRRCYEAVGGFLPLRHGGEDWAAQVAAEMKGWKVRTFPEIPVLHHGVAEDALTKLRHGVRQGQMDFALGSHPLFEVARLGRRFRIGLPALVCILRLLGFVAGYCKGDKRLVSREFVRFLRGRELQKLKQFGGVWNLRREPKEGERRG